MSPKLGARNTGIDLTFVFDRDLGRASELRRIAPLLTSLAPSWSTALRIWRGRGQEPIPLPADDPDQFAKLSLQAATARGPTFEALNKLFGAGDDRQTGSLEIRGGNLGLTVVMGIDAAPYVVQRSGRGRLGNHLSFQIRTQKLEGGAAADWALAAFERVCDVLEIGRAHV